MRGWKRPHIITVIITVVVPMLVLVPFLEECTVFRPFEGIELAANGRSPYRIVISADASPSTLFAAVELQRHLHKITGAELPIVPDDFRMKSREIILGDNEHLRSLDIDIDFESLGDEGYVLKTAGRHIVIAGGERRGTLYGVYGLLEDHLDCRWFTAKVSRIPEQNRLILPALDERVVPVFSYREPYTCEAFDGAWAARNRMNRNSKSGGLGVLHGGKVEWVPDMFVHTFDKLVPPEEYFRDHPEYFAMVDGSRRSRRTQLCTTNEEVIEIVTGRVLELFRTHPWADVVSISQNDWDNHCECPECRAVAEREGSDIAPVLMMVNRVAEAVEKEFPDKLVETLAYQWTRKPPKTIRPRDNVVIRLCTIECCFSHPLATCDSEENRAFTHDLRAWSDVAGNLWVWNYVTSFAHYFVPYPNLKVRDDNLRFFAENGVTGVFQQDVYTTAAGELSELSAYLNAKLLWDPSYDEDQAIDEFLGGVYGAAAGPIRAYIDLLHDEVNDHNIHMGIWQGPDAEYLSDRVLSAADSLWNAAASAVAGQPEILQRVQSARLSVEYALLHRRLTTGAAHVVDHGSCSVTVDSAYTARLERFAETAERAGVRRLKEYGYTVEQYLRDMRISATVPELTWCEPEKVENAGHGVRYRYYDGEWNSIPRFARLSPEDDGLCGCLELPFAGRMETHGFAFTGHILAPEDGVYTFYTRSDGLSTLSIGNERLIYNTGMDDIRERCGYAALKKGLHPLYVSFATREDGSRLEVSWRGPGFDRRPVENRDLFVGPGE